MIKVEPKGDEVFVSVDGSVLQLMTADGDAVSAELPSIELLRGNTAADFPRRLTLYSDCESGFGINLFTSLSIRRDDGDVSLQFYCYRENNEWEHRYGLGTLLTAIADQARHGHGLRVVERNTDHEEKSLMLSKELKATDLLRDSIEAAANEIAALAREAEIALGGLKWKPKYSTNERPFCTELLLPLLRRMRFVDVRYTQGSREYGRDFTFSEPTPFGSLRHYGLQAKAGNVRGNVRGTVDELIAQIDDAFKMPYHELGASEPRFISTFIIAISGSFTANAKEKIAAKASPGLRGSVYFLDRDRIMDLVDRYWLGNVPRPGAAHRTRRRTTCR